MIQLIRLLKEVPEDYSESVRFAKGFFEYPKSIKETFSKFKKDLTNGY